MKMKKTLLALLMSLLSFVFASAQEQLFEFMPKGGKSLLLRVIRGRPPRQLVLDIATATKTQQQWLAYLPEKSHTIAVLAGFSENEAHTLAAYLATNMPLSTAQLPNGLDEASWSKVLPPDGKQIALNNCQFCHTVFAFYLTQDRDARGWKGTFEVPFHKEIELTEKEQETFANYSAINMPVPEEKIPYELRF